MLGAVKLHNEVITVMNLYALNAIVSIKIARARSTLTEKKLEFNTEITNAITKYYLNNK